MNTMDNMEVNEVNEVNVVNSSILYKGKLLILLKAGQNKIVLIYDIIMLNENLMELFVSVL